MFNKVLTYLLTYIYFTVYIRSFLNSSQTLYLFLH